jgi:hypothetical protein
MTIETQSNTRKTAEAQTELWRLLCDVWAHTDLDKISKVSSFGRHNFAGIIQDALQDLNSRPDRDRPKIMAAMDRFLEEIMQLDSDLMIRPQLEQGTLLFGMCLSLVNRLSENDHELGTKFIIKISHIFQTILYDDGQAKKVLWLKMSC